MLSPESDRCLMLAGAAGLRSCHLEGDPAVKDCTNRSPDKAYQPPVIMTLSHRRIIFRGQSPALSAGRRSDQPKTAKINWKTRQLHLPSISADAVLTSFCRPQTSGDRSPLVVPAARSQNLRKSSRRKRPLQELTSFSGTSLLGSCSRNADVTLQATKVLRPPLLRVLATRKELGGMMLEGLAKAAVEDLANNADVTSPPFTPVSITPVETPVVGSRRNTRELRVMAAIEEKDGEMVPRVMNLMAQVPKTVNLTAENGAEAGRGSRRNTRRGTKKAVTWDKEVIPGEAVQAN
jgi:hypothetical protein